jgi:hypothetical protein
MQEQRQSAEEFLGGCRPVPFLSLTWNNHDAKMKVSGAAVFCVDASQGRKYQEGLSGIAPGLPRNFQEELP